MGGPSISSSWHGPDSSIKAPLSRHGGARRHSLNYSLAWLSRPAWAQGPVWFSSDPQTSAALPPQPTAQPTASHQPPAYCLAVPGLPLLEVKWCQVTNCSWSLAEKCFYCLFLNTEFLLPRPQNEESSKNSSLTNFLSKLYSHEPCSSQTRRHISQIWL